MVAIASLVSSGAHYLLLIVFQSQPSASWALREVIWPHLWQTVVIAPLGWRTGGRKHSPNKHIKSQLANHKLKQIPNYKSKLQTSSNIQITKPLLAGQRVVLSLVF